MTTRETFGNSFSSQEILEGIMRWAAVESPSVSPDAVARMFGPTSC